jgi:hypothetical protein
MKWLALSLLAINVFVWFAGDLWIPDRTRMVATAQTLPRISTLKLDADVPSSDANGVEGDPGSEVTGDVESEVKSDVESDVKSDVESDVKSDVSGASVLQTCVRLGWFETADGAREVYRSLGSPGGVYAIREQERALEPLHWVIIPPQPEDDALRLFNDLQRRGIDSYLVTRGENANAISLGLFQSRAAAERILEAKKRQNLNAILANFPRNQLRYALVFEVSRAGNANAGDGWVRDYQDNFDMVEISRCEGIATTPENP